MPKVSMIVPVFNGMKYIDLFLNQLKGTILKLKSFLLIMDLKTDLIII